MRPPIREDESTAERGRVADLVTKRSITIVVCRSTDHSLSASLLLAEEVSSRVLRAASGVEVE